MDEEGAPPGQEATKAEEEEDDRYARFQPKFDTEIDPQTGQPYPHHRYCQWCGKVDRGPHKGKTLEMLPPEHEGESKRPKYQAADEERLYTEEDLQAEGLDSSKAHNLGGHICPNCLVDQFTTSWRRHYDEATVQAKKQELRERLRKEQSEGA